MSWKPDRDLEKTREVEGVDFFRVDNKFYYRIENGNLRTANPNQVRTFRRRALVRDYEGTRLYKDGEFRNRS